MTTAPADISSTPVRVPKMAELVARRLRRQIVSGELPGGAPLPPEARLMAQFGVSRPTLREAFRVLEAEGLIEIRRGAHGGARARTPSNDAASRYAALVLEYRGTTLEDVYDARNIIEPPCAAILARRHTDTDLESLRTQLDRTQACLNDPAMAIQLLNDFHALLTDLAGNQTLTVLSGMLRGVIDRSTERRVLALADSPRGATALRDGFREHVRVVALIAEGADTAADRAWRRHLADAQKHTLSGAYDRSVHALIG